MAQRNSQDANVKQESKVTENGGNSGNQASGPNQQQGGGGGGGGGASGVGHQNHPFQRRNRFGGPGGPRGGGHQGGHQPNQFHNQGGPMDGDRKDRKFRPRMQGIKNDGGPGNEGGQGNEGRQGNRGGPGGPRNPDDRIMERLQNISGPSFDLAPLDMSEKKFAGRNRLYVGNLPADTTENDLNEMFKAYGETSEIFINKEKNFGFIRVDYHANAEKAKRELDGTVRKGRMLKVRFAPNGATIKVKNLTPWVTNELLYTAFSVFGEIERCVIIVDDRGKTTGEGIVEFTRKPGAMSALKRCSDGCFFLTSSLRPVIVENYEQMDMSDGYSEKSVIKKSQEYHQAREIGPRFAAPGSFEHEYGTRWKQLHELYKQKEQALKQELAMEEDKLEAQMQYAKFENETEMLREQLRAREMDRERQKREWEERERLVEEQRRRNEEQMRLQQEEMQMRIHSQEEDIRRRQQENSLFMQAHQLSNMLDQQEQVIQSYNSPLDNSHDYEQGGQEGQPPMDPKSFMNSYERSHRYEGRGMGEGQGPRGSGRAHWGNDNRRDDYQSKRRRY